MNNQIVKFVIDKELDIANHLIGSDAYKRNKDRGFKQKTNEKFERWITLSKSELLNEIEKEIEPYYKKVEKLNLIAEDINNEWIKIEKDFIKKLELVHKNPFPDISIKGVLSSAGRFGYNINECWFATNMFGNKFTSIDIAIHELMHFIFNKYYRQICQERELNTNQIWDVKEAFTVLLNLEFNDFMFQQDKGYVPHEKLREIISESWKKEHDFDKALESAIIFVKENKIAEK